MQFSLALIFFDLSWSLKFLQLHNLSIKFLVSLVFFEMPRDQNNYIMHVNFELEIWWFPANCFDAWQISEKNKKWYLAATRAKYMYIAQKVSSWVSGIIDLSHSYSLQYLLDGLIHIMGTGEFEFVTRGKVWDYPDFVRLFHTSTPLRSVEQSKEWQLGGLWLRKSVTLSWLCQTIPYFQTSDKCRTK